MTLRRHRHTEGATGAVREVDSPGIHGIVELTLEVHDLAAMRDFYARCLGLRVLAERDDRVWLAVGDHARLGLWSPGPKEFGDEGGRHVHYAIGVAPTEISRLHQRLVSLDAPVRDVVEHEGGDRSLYFEDPEGNVVEAWDVFSRGEGAREGVAVLDDAE